MPRRAAAGEMRASIDSDSLRLVMLEAVVLLGPSGWREMYAKVGLMMIEPDLLAVAGREALPDQILKPRAPMAIWLVDETIYALAREDKGVTRDDTIALLRDATLEWAARLGEAVEADSLPKATAA